MPWSFDVAKYPENMKGMIGTFTHIGGNGNRTRNSTANALHDITVKANGAQVTLFLNEADLYLFGFRNAQGSFRFNDKAVPGATALPIGCSYTAANCISVLRDRTSGAATANRNLASISGAIANLSAYNGGPVTGADLGLMCYFISESFRFRNIFHRMVRVVKNGAAFTFVEFADWVTNWANLSGGVPVPVAQGAVSPTPADLATYQ
jgi:hypothetical protein